MGALSDFLSHATAAWWGVPAGASLGATAGQLIAGRSSRHSDQRRIREERVRLLDEKVSTARKERLDRAGTIGVSVINAADELADANVPAHIAYFARRLTRHLPRDWPWATAWTTLFDNVFHWNVPRLAYHRRSQQPPTRKANRTNPITRIGPSPTPTQRLKRYRRNHHHTQGLSVDRGLA